MVPHMTTVLTVLTARPGGYVGPGHVHPAVIDALREEASSVRASGRAADAYVARCGGTLALIASGVVDPSGLSSCFEAAAEVARRLGQHGAPGLNGHGGLAVEVTQLAFEERASEPVLVVLT